MTIEGGTPPVNAEAERSVLGAMMLSKDALSAGLERLVKDDFLSPNHRIIFECLAELFLDNAHVDITSLYAKLCSKPAGQSVTRTYLVSLAESCNTDKKIFTVCGIVKDCANRRRVRQIGLDLYSDAGNDFLKLDDTVQKYVPGLFALEPQAQPGVHRRLDFLDRYFNKKSKGLATGFTDLDNATGGFNEGDFIILGGRPSLGKTAWAVQVAVRLAKAGVKVLFYSLEMTKETLEDRIAVSELKVDRFHWTTGRLTPDELKKFADATNEGGSFKLIEQNLLIDDNSHIPRRLEITARLHRARHNFEIMFLDYIGLLAEKADDNQSVSQASKTLKTLAKTLRVPVVGLSQLKRPFGLKAGERYDPRPGLTDLRASGSLEQDADGVGFLWNPVRPLMTLPQAELTEAERSKIDDWKHRVRLIWAKNRNGARGEWDLAWFPDYTRFENMAREDKK